MVPPLIVLKIKNQKGKVYVPSMGIEITVIDTDPKGLYIVGKNDKGETVCVDSVDCEPIKDNDINKKSDNVPDTVNKINNDIKINSSVTNKINQVNEEDPKGKTKKFGSLLRKNKTK